MSSIVITLRINLTLEVEHYTIYLIKLKKRSKKVSLIYVLKNCRCISILLLISCRFTNYKKVIYSLCV
jgi:hypothetical protein